MVLLVPVDTKVPMLLYIISPTRIYSCTTTTIFQHPISWRLLIKFDMLTSYDKNLNLDRLISHIWQWYEEGALISILVVKSSDRNWNVFRRPSCTSKNILISEKLPWCWDICTEVKKMQGTSIALAIISVPFEKETAFSGKVNFYYKDKTVDKTSALET